MEKLTKKYGKAYYHLAKYYEKDNLKKSLEYLLKYEDIDNDSLAFIAEYYTEGDVRQLEGILKKLSFTAQLSNCTIDPFSNTTG